jgi:hypothetical protein
VLGGDCRKLSKSLKQDSRCSGRDSIPTPPRYRPTPLLLEPSYSVRIIRNNFIKLYDSERIISNSDADLKKAQR